MEHKREIWDTIYLTALQGLNYVAPLIVFPYLMVVLGAEKFGYIGFSLSITQYLMLVVDFGFNLSATKRVALAKENPTELQKIISATLISKLVLLVISFLILLIFIFAISRFSIYSSTMMIMFLMVIGNTFSFIWLFQGLGKIRVISIVNIISKLLIFPLTFVFVKKSDDYLNAAIILSSVYILSSIITCIILVNKKYLANWIQPTIKRISEEIKASYPIFLSNTATSLYTTLFAVILAYFSTPEEVGKYTAAEKIMRGFCYIAFIPVAQSFYPKISALSLNDSYRASKLVSRIALFMSFIMVFVFIILFFFSDYITYFLGEDYNGTTSIFRIMAIIPFFIAVGGVFGQLGILALGNEKEKRYFKNVYLLAALIALISIVILTPLYLSIGTAAALLITELFVFISMSWKYKKLK